MGKDDVNIGRELVHSPLLGTRVRWCLGIQTHPNDGDPLHISQGTAVSVSASAQVAEAAATGTVQDMLDAADTYAPAMRDWMDEVAGDSRAVAIGGLGAVRDGLKVQHLYG